MQVEDTAKFNLVTRQISLPFVVYQHHTTCKRAEEECACQAYLEHQLYQDTYRFIRIDFYVLRNSKSEIVFNLLMIQD